MSKQEIIDIIRNSKPILEARYSVKRLGLFGSWRPRPAEKEE